MDYYHQLMGKWKDASSMVWGGSGHNSSGGIVPTKYMFPEDSDLASWSTQGAFVSPSNWSEFNGGPLGSPRTPGDRKGVGSVGPITFEPGQVQKVTIALVSARDYSGSGPQAAVGVMKERIDSIHSYFRAGIITECQPNVSYRNSKRRSKTNEFSNFP